MLTMGRNALFVLGIAVLFAAASAALEDGLQWELLARIEALELKGQEQATLIQTQAEAIKQIEKKLIVQDVKIFEREEKINNYELKIVQLEEKVAQLSTNERDGNADSLTSIQSVQPMKMDHIVKRGSNRLRRSDVAVNGLVAFHATVKNEVTHLGLGHPIVFPDALLNLGSGYHKQHGLFIAPHSGLYLFSASIMADNNGHTEINVKITKNGEILGSAYAHGDSGRHDQGSVTVVTQLVAGDEVWVKLHGPSDTSIWGDYCDSFMGCLLFPM